MKFDMKNVGIKFRKSREEQHLTTKDVANKCGISHSYIGAIERSEKVPSLAMFTKLCEGLNLSPTLALCEDINTDDILILKLDILKMKSEKLNITQLQILIDLADSLNKNN